MYYAVGFMWGSVTVLWRRLRLFLQFNGRLITLATVFCCVVSTYGGNNLKFAASQTSHMVIPRSSQVISVLHGEGRLKFLIEEWCFRRDKTILHWTLFTWLTQTAETIFYHLFILSSIMYSYYHHGEEESLTLRNKHIWIAYHHFHLVTLSWKK